MGILLSLALLIPTCVHADEIKIPFPVYMEDFKADMKSAGIDLYGNKDSVGFVEEKGGEFVVYTYKKSDIYVLDMVQKLTWKNIRK